MTPDTLEVAAMRRALISDIHGNLEALNAVLNDIATQRVNEIFCLGDIVGHGPNPCECIDLVMQYCRVTLLGNNDKLVVDEIERPNIPDDSSVFWTRNELNRPGNRLQDGLRKAFLAHLTRSYEIGPHLFVHGSARNPLSEYVFPEDCYNRRKIDRLFELIGHYCFQGHTHVPGILTESYQHFCPREILDEYPLGPEKLMVNVGSVGQPRDGDDRACYVVLDDALTDDARDDGIDKAGLVSSPKIIYRRVPFDFETTIRKIKALT